MGCDQNEWNLRCGPFGGFERISGFGVQGLGFRGFFMDLGFRVYCLELRVYGPVPRVRPRSVTVTCIHPEAFLSPKPLNP